MLAYHAHKSLSIATHTHIVPTWVIGLIVASMGLMARVASNMDICGFNLIGVCATWKEHIR